MIASTTKHICTLIWMYLGACALHIIKLAEVTSLKCEAESASLLDIHTVKRVENCLILRRKSFFLCLGMWCLQKMNFHFSENSKSMVPVKEEKWQALEAPTANGLNNEEQILGQRPINSFVISTCPDVETIVPQETRLDTEEASSSSDVGNQQQESEAIENLANQEVVPIRNTVPAVSILIQWWLRFKLHHFAKSESNKNTCDFERFYYEFCNLC